MSQCPVCGGEEDIVAHTCRVKPFQGKTMRGHQCRSCGLIRYPENLGHYAEDHCPAALRGRAVRSAQRQRRAPGARVLHGRDGHGNRGQAQRQRQLLRLGPEHRPPLAQAEAYPEVQTKLVDLENMQEAENFETIAEATPSDVVIASEVIEHFTEPVAHFESLLRLLKDDGILICSSNIYDGSNVALHQYPFVPGHVAYWTPLALIKMASRPRLFRRLPHAGSRPDARRPAQEVHHLLQAHRDPVPHEQLLRHPHARAVREGVSPVAPPAGAGRPTENRPRPVFCWGA